MTQMKSQLFTKKIKTKMRFFLHYEKKLLGKFASKKESKCGGNATVLSLFGKTFP